MNRLTTLRWLISIGAVLLLPASALAQAGSGAGTDSERSPAETSIHKGSQLSGEEMLKQADAYLNKMKETLGHIERLAKQARKEKDIIKLNCVNDKLMQARGNMNLGEQSYATLRVAVSRNDDGGRAHEFAKLTITYQKVVVLGQEAEACIGEEISYVGDTKVEVDMDKDIPQDDPTVVKPPFVWEMVVRPPLASPFI